ncbi:uncharacterized protein L201_007958 [Kwoniella dendrophila CBS 6074]|uniref:F-box domain-containing protein n=1 Tax=Kwoniella dendrophila CBS 6074 TaxID=1295534 RepID=A0AAX4K769_9TREE
MMRWKLKSFQSQNVPPRIAPGEAPKLPFDLFPLIVSFVSANSTLHALTLTNKYLNQIATPRLYDLVKLPDCQAVRSFILYTPQKYKTQVKTFHIHFNLSQWDIDTFKFQQKHKREIETCKLVNLENLIVTSSGIQQIFRDKGSLTRITSLARLFDNWVHLFCPDQGPKSFKGRQVDDKGWEDSVIWAKAPLFELLYKWHDNLEYLDLPKIPAFESNQWIDSYIESPRQANFRCLKQITIDIYNLDSFSRRGTGSSMPDQLEVWLDRLSFNLNEARNTKVITGKADDHDRRERNMRILLNVRPPNPNNTRQLEGWITKKETRITAFRVIT